MAVDFDNAWLTKQGLDGKGSAKTLDAVIGEFELRVGNKLVAKLTKPQLAKFEKIEDEDARFDYLDEVYPEFESEVEKISEDLDAEITKAGDKKKLIASWAD